MQIGFGAPVSGAWATPDNLAAFAARAEQAGYASLWSFQRLLVPEGSGMEPVYHSVLDPMVALAYAAAVTRGSGSAWRWSTCRSSSPGYLAKQAATVDVLSGGRLDLGLGIGWMPEEFTLTGAAMARRGARTAEYIAVLRTLWADGVRPSSAASSTRCRGLRAAQAGPAPAARRSCSAGWPGPPWSAPGGWRTAGSPPAGPTCPGSPRASAWSGRRPREAGRDPDAIRFICRGVVRAGAPVTGPRGQRPPAAVRQHAADPRRRRLARRSRA